MIILKYFLKDLDFSALKWYTFFNWFRFAKGVLNMRLASSLKQTVKYFFHFISLSFYFSYGYFYLSKKVNHNGLLNMLAA